MKKIIATPLPAFPVDTPYTHFYFMDEFPKEHAMVIVHIPSTPIIGSTNRRHTQ